MEDDELMAHFRRGLIPGPQETEKMFLERAKARPALSSPAWNTISPQLFTRWGFSIDWVPILYSSKKLLPWEGAVCWIQESRPPLIQLRPSLQTQKLWGNSHSDILLHEAIHAARESFNEPQFEEFLAYSTSPSPWKRWLGPLFQRPWEFPLFALTTFLLPWFPWFATPLLALFIGRFLYKHLLFQRLKKILPLPILLCLTDQEIKQQAPFQKETMQNKSFSPRLQLIQALKKRLD